MNNPSQATNWALIKAGLLYSFVPNIAAYRCPSDRSTDVRSYAMQEQLACYQNGRPYDSNAAIGIEGYPPMYTEGQMRKLAPALTLVFLDDAPPNINDGFFFVSAVGPQWSDAPASWHSKGCNLSFADGHAEYWHWQDPRMWTLANGATTANNPDMLRMQAALGSM